MEDLTYIYRNQCSMFYINEFAAQCVDVVAVVDLKEDNTNDPAEFGDWYECGKVIFSVKLFGRKKFIDKDDLVYLYLPLSVRGDQLMGVLYSVSCKYILIKPTQLTPKLSSRIYQQLYNFGFDILEKSDITIKMDLKEGSTDYITNTGDIFINGVDRDAYIIKQMINDQNMTFYEKQIDSHYIGGMKNVWQNLPDGMRTLQSCIQDEIQLNKKELFQHFYDICKKQQSSAFQIMVSPLFQQMDLQDRNPNLIDVIPYWSPRLNITHEHKGTDEITYIPSDWAYSFKFLYYIAPNFDPYKKQTYKFSPFDVFQENPSGTYISRIPQKHMYNRTGKKIEYGGCPAIIGSLQNGFIQTPQIDAADVPLFKNPATFLQLLLLSQEITINFGINMIIPIAMVDLDNTNDRYLVYGYEPVIALIGAPLTECVIDYISQFQLLAQVASYCYIQQGNQYIRVSLNNRQIYQPVPNRAQQAAILQQNNTIQTNCQTVKGLLGI